MNEDMIEDKIEDKEVKDNLKLLNLHSNMMMKLQYLIVEATQIDPLFSFLKRSELEALSQWIEDQIKNSESETEKKIFSMFIYLINNYIST